MIILDTNVVSEIMRGQDMDSSVLEWVRGLDETPCTTVVTKAEILAGLAVLPDGKRRRGLEKMAALVFDQLSMCLSADAVTAEHYAAVFAASRSAGRPLGAMDGLIAAIVRQHHAVLATRNTKDYEATGINVVNPWH
ncbi:MAG: type II toxin-antitoxin system VapC family toxin [Actinomycetaceae bacterium]|nr:type II toxin-antitoxin system VapC family toxin [Actinomycetaceae bacterium]